MQLTFILSELFLPFLAFVRLSSPFFRYKSGYYSVFVTRKKLSGQIIGNNDTV
jgi:hypothetical protein